MLKQIQVYWLLNILDDLESVNHLITTLMTTKAKHFDFFFALPYMPCGAEDHTTERLINHCTKHRPLNELEGMRSLDELQYPDRCTFYISKKKVLTLYFLCSVIFCSCWLFSLHPSRIKVLLKSRCKSMIF